MNSELGSDLYNAIAFSAWKINSQDYPNVHIMCLGIYVYQYVHMHMVCIYIYVYIYMPIYIVFLSFILSDIYAYTVCTYI